jgi:hypothetical protein
MGVGDDICFLFSSATRLLPVLYIRNRTSYNIRVNIPMKYAQPEIPNDFKLPL